MSDRGLTQDILLRIKAQNNTAADMKAATDAVTALTSAIDKHSEAARKGELSEAGLRNEIKNLNDAAKGLTGITALIDSYKNFSQQIENFGKQAEAAKAKLAEQQAAIAATGKATSEQAKELKSLEGALKGVEKSLEASRKGFSDTSDALKRAGIDTNSLADAEQRLRQAADASFAGVAQLNTALTNYASNRRAATEADREATAAAEALAAAEKTLNEQLAAADRQAVENTARLKAQNESRSKAIIDRDRTDGPSVTVQPDKRGQNVETTLQQRNAEKDASLKAGQEIAAAREAQIAKEVTTRQAAAALVGAAIQKSFDDEKERTIKALNEIATVREKAEADRRQKSFAESVAANAKLIKEEEDARAATEAAAKARQEAAAKSSTAQRAATAQFDDFVKKYRSGQKDMTEAAKDAERRTPLSVGARTTDAKGTVGRGEGQQANRLGFKPYELTNLGYQANDVIGGVLQGQNPIQILAQQGPQIVQILGARLLPLLPLITAGVVALGAAFEVLSHSMREVNSIREFNTAITANANAIGYDAQALVGLQKQIKDLGTTWADAGTIIKQSIEANIRSDRMKEFGATAQHMADAFGKKVPDAMKELVQGMTGGSEALRKFIGDYQALRPEQIKHIEDLLKEGKLAEATDYTFRAFSETMRKTADNLSPVTKEFRLLSKAWDDLWISMSGKDFGSLIESFIALEERGLRRIINGLREYLNLAKQAVGLPPLPDPNAPATPTGPARLTNPQALTLDSDTLQQLSRLLGEASKSLPPGYSVQAISTQRDNAIVAGKGTLSEHGFHRAIDVKIVDANGNAVPGYMKEGGPLYDQLDAAMVAAAKKAGVGPIAIGSTFGTKDAGHYSLGGPEAIANSAKRGVAALASVGPGLQTGPTTKQTIDSEKMAQADEERLGKQRAINEAAELELVRRKAIAEAEAQNLPKAAQDAHVKAALDEEIYKQTIERRARDDRDAKAKIDNFKHYNEIELAGERAVAKARAEGTTNYRDLDAVRQRGKSEEKDRLARKDAADDLVTGAQGELAARQAINEQAEIEEVRRKALKEIQDKTNDAAVQHAFVEAKVAKALEQQAVARKERAIRDEKFAQDNAKYLDAAKAAGDKAVAEAQGGSPAITGYKDLDAIRQKAMAAEVDRLKLLDVEDDKIKALQHTLSGLKAGIDKKDAYDLGKALDAVNEKFKQYADQVKKARETAITPEQKSTIDDLEKQIESVKKLYEAEARLQAFRDQGKAATQTRNTLIQTYTELEEKGAISIGEKEAKIKEAYQLTNKAANDAADAIQKIIDTSENLSPEKVALLTAEVKKLRAEAVYADPFMSGLRKTFIDSIGTNATTALNTVSEALGKVIAKTGTWKDVWVSMRAAAGAFFAGILKDLAAYIIKAELAKLLSAAIGTGTGAGTGGGFLSSLFGSAGGAAAGTAAASGTGASTAALAVIHGGGVVGHSALPTRSVDGFWFRNAPRYHTGTMVGLRSDEQAAILQRGEEVLANDNPRNMKNWAGQQSSRPQDVNIRNVLVADPELVPSHMGSARGEKVIMNVLKRNSATVRQLVS